MSDDDDAFQFEVKIQRGNGTDDRDTFKGRVSAETIGELNEKVEELREKIEDWATEFRRIQPAEAEVLDEDQSTLDGMEGEA